MPKIITICTHCGKNLRLEDQYIDKNIRCPLCNGVFKVIQIALQVDKESTLPEALATRSEPAKPTSIRPEPPISKAPSVGKPIKKPTSQDAPTLPVKSVAPPTKSPTTKANVKSEAASKSLPSPQKETAPSTDKKSSKDSGSSEVVNQVPENSAVAHDDSGSTPSNAKAKIGRYIVRKELGRGAFGTVYAAEDPILKRNVAIKLRSRQGDEEYDQTVIREARAAGKLRHPNIVAVYEVDVASGRPFVVSELIEGQTLAEMIQEGPLKPLDAAALIRDLAKGMAYAHSQGIVHRDIKPQNILVDASGRAQITDFGLAVDRTNELQAREAAYSQAGTLAYMAPEQAGFGGVSVGPAVDQYALGATLLNWSPEAVPMLATPLAF